MKWEEGRVSGAIYCGGKELTEVLTKVKKKVLFRGINLLTSLSDQDRISPYNINTISSRQVMEINNNTNWGTRN